MGKLNDDTLKWTLEVNGKPAMKEMNELEQSTRKLERTNKDLRVEMAKMEAHGKKNTAEYKALGAQIKANSATMTTNKARMEQLRKEVGLSALTTKQLRDEYRRLKTQMDNTTPGTPEWKKLRGELTAVQGRMSDLNTTGQKTNSMFGQFKTLLPVLGVAALVAKIGQLSRELLGLAIRLEGDNRRATIVFGESLAYVEGEAKKLSKAMGVTTKEFIAAAVGTADLLVPLDFTRDAAAKMSVQLQSLSGALDEWTGGRFGAAEVSNILTKAMLGENEQLKTLGIAIRKDSEEFTSLVKIKMQDATVTKAQAEAMATLELIQKKSLDAQTAYTQDGNELLRLQKDISRWWRQLKEDSTKYIYSILSGIKAIIEYKDVIIPAIAATATYAIAANAAAIKQGIFTLATNIGQKAMALFNKTVKSNPLVLFLSLLAGAATALYMFSTRTTAAQKAQKELDNVMLEGKKNIVEQKVEMELLLKTAKDETKSKEARITAIKKLNEISPEYLGNLTLETINTEEAKKATDLYILSLEKKARVQAAQDKLVEIEKQLLDLRVEGAGAETDFWQDVTTGIQTMGNASAFAATSAGKIVSNWKEKEDELLKTKEKLLDVIDKTNEAQTTGGGKPIPTLTLEAYLKAHEKEFTAWKESRKKFIQDQNLFEFQQITSEDSIKSRIDAEKLTDQRVKEEMAKWDAAINQEFLLGEEEVIEDDPEIVRQMAINQMELDLWSQTQEGKLAIAEKTMSKEEMMQKAHQYSMQKMDQQTNKAKLQSAMQYVQMASQIANGLSMLYTMKMNQELKAAGDNEAAKEAIQKKYAKKQQNVAVMQALMNGALSIMSMWATAPNPIIGAIYTAIVAAVTTAEVGVIKSQQFAQGNRQKILADDGKTYNANVASPNHASGLFNEPTYVPGFGLFGETRDPELVFNPRDTQAIINSPALIDAINMTLGGARQYAQGNSREIIRENNTVTNTTMDADTKALLDDIRKKLDEPATAYLVADEDYIRTHKKKVTEYDTFQNRIKN